jgi:tRNA1Val (adenine37-N6)-methyltransferase
MPNTYFSFKQFTIWQDQAAMKVTTDACLFGAWASEHIQQHSPNLHHTTAAYRMADVGAGTGLLSLMIRQKNPGYFIEALEIDPLAADQARKNISIANAEAHIEVYTTDASTFSPLAPYDCIVSNPPFYQDDLKAAEQRRNWAFHEETLTLSQIFTFINNNLSAAGYFYLLLPARREKDIEALLHDAQLTLTDKVQVKTSPPHSPHRVLLAGQRKQTAASLITQPTAEKEICVTDESGQYSPAFKELLKEYYLAL